jgi:hypothetical protein
MLIRSPFEVEELQGQREATMAIRDLLKTHRTWEDAVGLWLGLVIGLSPWFYDEPSVPAVVVNSGGTGLAVLAIRGAGEGDLE